MVLSLAPFAPETVAAMLRVDVRAVTDCLERWFAGIDPELPPEMVAPPQAIGTSSITSDGPAAAAAAVPDGPSSPPSAPEPMVAEGSAGVGPVPEPIATAVVAAAPGTPSDPVVESESLAVTDAAPGTVPDTVPDAAPNTAGAPPAPKVKRRRFRRRRTFK